MFIIKHVLIALSALLVGAAMAAVDVNTASENDLDSIKGIGPSTAAKMMTVRKQAPFKDWNDLIQRLSGLGEKRAIKLSAEGLTVNGAPYKPGKGSSTDAPSVSDHRQFAPPRNLPIAIAPRY